MENIEHQANVQFMKLKAHMVTYDHKIQFVTLYTETLDFNVIFAKKEYFCPHQQ